MMSLKNFIAKYKSKRLWYPTNMADIIWTFCTSYNLYDDNIITSLYFFVKYHLLMKIPLLELFQHFCSTCCSFACARLVLFFMCQHVFDDPSYIFVYFFFKNYLLCILIITCLYKGKFFRLFLGMISWWKSFPKLFCLFSVNSIYVLNYLGKLFLLLSLF